MSYASSYIPEQTTTRLGPNEVIQSPQAVVYSSDEEESTLPSLTTSGVLQNIKQERDKARQERDLARLEYETLRLERKMAENGGLDRPLPTYGQPAAAPVPNPVPSTRTMVREASYGTPLPHQTSVSVYSSVPEKQPEEKSKSLRTTLILSAIFCCLTLGVAIVASILVVDLVGGKSKTASAEVEIMNPNGSNVTLAPSEGTASAMPTSPQFPTLSPTMLEPFTMEPGSIPTVKPSSVKNSTPPDVKSSLPPSAAASPPVQRDTTQAPVGAQIGVSTSVPTMAVMPVAAPVQPSDENGSEPATAPQTATKPTTSSPAMSSRAPTSTGTEVEPPPLSAGDPCVQPTVFCTKRELRDALQDVDDVSGWDVSRIADFSGLMRRIRNCSPSGMATWNMSSATTLREMFSGCESFNQPIGEWDVSSVTDMTRMFSRATSFNQPIGRWRVSQVTTMQAMFREATSFDQDLSGWNVESVKNFANMFYDAESFNRDLCSWRPFLFSLFVGQFLDVFEGTQCPAFDLPLSNGAVVRDSQWCFYRCA